MLDHVWLCWIVIPFSLKAELSLQKCELQQQRALQLVASSCDFEFLNVQKHARDSSPHSSKMDFRAFLRQVEVRVETSSPFYAISIISCPINSLLSTAQTYTNTNRVRLKHLNPCGNMAETKGQKNTLRPLAWWRRRIAYLLSCLLGGENCQMRWIFEPWTCSFSVSGDAAALASMASKLRISGVMACANAKLLSRINKML